MSYGGGPLRGGDLKLHPGPGVVVPRLRLRRGIPDFGLNPNSLLFQELLLLLGVHDDILTRAPMLTAGKGEKSQTRIKTDEENPNPLYPEP